ncbi:hypothetical protein BHM03_00043760 [Ensete ventricosum]|nr:hypothetical protein BHM03_00043760 [Ensete ventricosum]
MQWELTEKLTKSSPKASRACREFTESSPKVIGSLLGRRWEFTEIRLRDSPEDRWRLPKSLSGWKVDRPSSISIRIDPPRFRLQELKKSG